MIVVTGAAGFIGSQIIKGLNADGVRHILAVDDLSDGRKFHNLAGCQYDDYMDYQDFLAKIDARQSFAEPIEAIFHEGACSDTTEWDGRYMMRNNYEYTKSLFHYCLDEKIAFLYASSAAVYGAKPSFQESDLDQNPLNVYGYSKWKFDEYMLRHMAKADAQVVGFRYFNVYGPHEQHKGRMASVAFHFMNQLSDTGVVRLFEGSHGYGDGEHRRDFICVDDVVKINLWFLRHPNKRGIFNVGTGQARAFKDIAKTLIDCHGSGEIKYIPFPEDLKKAYQAYTQADVSALRAAGYAADFTSLEAGLANYYAWCQPRVHA
jgi:ADP-L-glycero-D-manno-heptose 6-epimerase